MSRYIDVDKLLGKVADYRMNSSLLVNPVEIEEIIEQQPTADVVEVKRAYWEHLSDGYNEYYICMNCGEEIQMDYNEICTYRYCPNCGAKMMR